MDTDLALVVGLVIAVFSVPAALSALSDGRAPRVAAFAMIAGGALVVWALTQNPGGYRIADIPDVFVRVVASFLR